MRCRQRESKDRHGGTVAEKLLVVAYSTNITLLETDLWHACFGIRLLKAVLAPLFMQNKDVAGRILALTKAVILLQ